MAQVVALHVILAALLCADGQPPEAADRHLLAGARAFRQGRFAEALVEFKVAEKLGGGPDARAYAAAALVKLDRAEEAVEAFGGQATQDPVLEYYRALACYQARLYTCADRLLEASAGKFGPRVGEQARTLRAEIARLLEEEIRAETVDAYLLRGEQSLRDGRPHLAAGCFEEARVLGGRRKDCHGCRQAESGRERARAATVAREAAR